MVYVGDFESFIQQAEDLYRGNPLKTRYCIKYRHVDGNMVLKVTDDVTCLQFKTDQQQDLKKLERITTMFFALFSSGELPQADMMSIDQPQAAAQQQQQQQQGQGQQAKGKQKSRRKG